MSAFRSRYNRPPESAAIYMPSGAEPIFTASPDVRNLPHPVLWDPCVRGLKLEQPILLDRRSGGGSVEARNSLITKFTLANRSTLVAGYPLRGNVPGTALRHVSLSDSNKLLVLTPSEQPLTRSHSPFRIAQVRCKR